LGTVLRAFFVPPADIREAGHLNATVHFHLGFSYEGFRAWNVRLGPPPELPESASKPQKLWIGGIPRHYLEQDLIALFQPFGAVGQVEVPRDHEVGGNRGFAFVTMTRRDDAEIAIKELTGQILDAGRGLQVTEAIARQPD
jgi:RNA recognition motif-containing protein